MTFHCHPRVTWLFLGLLISGQSAYGEDQPVTRTTDKPAIKAASPRNDPGQLLDDASATGRDPAEVALARAAAKRAARQKAMDNECVIKQVMSNSEIQYCNRAK